MRHEVRVRSHQIIMIGKARGKKVGREETGRALRFISEFPLPFVYALFVCP